MEKKFQVVRIDQPYRILDIDQPYRIPNIRYGWSAKNCKSQNFMKLSDF